MRHYLHCSQLRLPGLALLKMSAQDPAEMDTSVSLEEDPAKFLARMREVCPDLFHIISTKQARLLSQANEPYELEEVNQSYMIDEGSYYAAKLMQEEVENDLSGKLMKPLTKGKSVNIEECAQTGKALKMITERMRLVIDSRLAATEEKHGECHMPRILRLAKKFNFTEDETRLTVAILVWQGSYFRENGRVNTYRYGSDPVSFSQLLQMPLTDVLSFFAKDNLHVEQGFFPDIQESYLLSCNLTFDNDFFKVLMGAKLKTNEFLKIEQTQLANVISEEPGNEHYRSEFGKLTGAGGDGGEEGKEEGEEEVAPGDQGEEQADSTDELLAEDQPMSMDAEADDLDTIIRLEREREKTATVDTAEDEMGVGEGSDKLKPYKKDLEYLDDHFQLIAYKLKAKSMDNRMEQEAQFDDGYTQTQRYQRQKREAQTKEKVQANKCEKRLALTKAAGGWMPRLERMVESRHLCSFEKSVLLALIGSIIQPNKFSAGDVVIGKNCAQVGDLLQLFCPTLEEQIHHRKYFYKSASLIREGMVVVHNSGLTGDPSSATVEVDRRMLDFCVGLDTEFSEIVEGSHLYFPKTKFEHVILPKEQKQLILNTVSNFEAYKRCRKKMGMDDAITYGAGMVMLFHGAPGTGKTMMANALANKLSKKVLLINFPSLGVMKADENFKFIFREAKINDAILFFDECEGIFESREMGGHHQVNLLLTEIERHDGLIILATNRPYDLDEAMHRRIMIAIEFRQPDHILRKSIWESHMPEQMKLGSDINLDELAVRFELTGGFIKNAILSALSIAVSRDGDNPVVSQKDLLQGANLQLRGRLRMKDFDRRVIPNAGLDEVVVEESIMKQLKQIVQFEKARSILFGQWGFAKRSHKGLTVLLHGQPGTGKTLVAEAIGYEVGKPLKVINCGELLSKWVGESTKNIDAIFQEAQHQDAILVFDEAEGLFGQRTATTSSTDRYANIDVGVLLYHIERFSGIVILTTNLIDNLDMAFFRRLRFVLQLDIPRQVLRAKLWKLIIPEETPLADDVDFDKLARHEMCGGNIKNVVFRAAAAAALRKEKHRKLTMDDLEESCEEELAKTAKRLGFRRQDSDAARIYN